MDLRSLRLFAAQNVAWVLVIGCVAVSAFLLGQVVRPQTSEITAGASSTDQPQGSSAISDIQQTLQAGIMTSSLPVSPSGATVDDSTAITASGLVSINSGTQTELETLPGIGPSKAKAIIDYRLANGSFVRIDDLTKVKGIGPKTLESLRSKISL